MSAGPGRAIQAGNLHASVETQRLGRRAQSASTLLSKRRTVASEAALALQQTTVAYCHAVARSPWASMPSRKSCQSRDVASVIAADARDSQEWVCPRR